MKSKIKSILIGLFILIVNYNYLHATDAVLKWDAATGDVTGYTIYYGLSEGSYPNNRDVGNVTQYALSNLSLSEGTSYYFVVRAYNSVGESGDSNLTTYTVPSSEDTTPPITPQGITGSLMDNSILIQWQANSETDLSGYRVYYGTASRNYGLPIPVSGTQYSFNAMQADVTYYIAVSAVDTSGNESGYSSEVNVTYIIPDTTSPAVTITLPTSETSYDTLSGSIDISGTAVDDTEVSSVTWTNSRGGSGTATGTSNWRVSDIALAEGENVITVMARDMVNNTSTDFLTVIYEIPDTTAPSITAPDDITLASSEPVAVDLGTPAVSDTADPNPAVSNDAPDLFPIGNTTVTWTAIDTSGNIAADTQTVTVNEAVPAGIISVADLDGSSDLGSKFWIAAAYITVSNTVGSADSVNVAGVWSDGSIVSCVTDNSGICSVTSRKSRKDSLTFTITDLSNGADNYDPFENKDYDGNSDGTTIIINRDGTISGTNPPEENMPPVANDDSATTEPGVSVAIDVLTNDSDEDGDSLSVTGVTDPDNGTVSYTSSFITYIPNGGYLGTDSFNYTVSDGNGGMASAAVTVAVQEVQELTTVYISGLSGEASGNNVKNVVVTITVNDNINNATVYGSWSGGASGIASCTTSGGQCSVNVRTKVLPVSFEVTDIADSILIYDENQNSSSSITVPQ